MAAMLELEAAQARLLALASPLAAERLPVELALGRYLAGPLLAARTQPPADLSAMDGFALRAADLPGPWQVIGESACGHPFSGTLGQGEAVRIATGALVPAGADTIVIQEDTAREGDRLSLAAAVPAGAGRHIRRLGMDFRGGDELLGAGTRIGPGQLALILSAGHGAVAVRRPPRLAIIDSGDELARDPASCAPHQIPASNGAMLAAMASATTPCEIARLGPVADRLEALVAALEGAANADVIVTSGGASVGDHDLIRPALAVWGAELDFWKVAIKPGKPIMVARKGGQLVVGLPGNPVSSHVTAYLFLLPLLRKLAGAAQCLPVPFAATLAEDLPAGGPRREFLRASFDGVTVCSRANQDSSALGSLARGNALIDRPAEAPPARLGEVVQVYLIENGGIA